MLSVSEIKGQTEDEGTQLSVGDQKVETELWEPLMEPPLLDHRISPCLTSVCLSPSVCLQPGHTEQEPEAGREDKEG